MKRKEVEPKRKEEFDIDIDALLAATSDDDELDDVDDLEEGLWGGRSLEEILNDVSDDDDDVAGAGVESLENTPEFGVSVHDSTVAAAVLPSNGDSNLSLTVPRLESAPSVREQPTVLLGPSSAASNGSLPRGPGGSGSPGSPQSLDGRDLSFGQWENGRMEMNQGKGIEGQLKGVAINGRSLEDLQGEESSDSVSFNAILRPTFVLHGADEREEKGARKEKQQGEVEKGGVGKEGEGKEGEGMRCDVREPSFGQWKSSDNKRSDNKGGTEGRAWREDCTGTSMGMRMGTGTGMGMGLDMGVGMGMGVGHE
ncbi:unnamed protein product, partial [Closterium sp. NIES-54]